ncbi:DUF4065 domain-containing protein [Lachnospiraceae bacterium OttesenSCG-928-D06]|nr:DUF4065 domain-containing protein [Lachnospiraceae bacterium OttesenSCG-928-D06]
MNTIIERIQYDCPFCEEIHEVEVREYESEGLIKGRKTRYLKKCYYCAVEDEEFAPASIMDENLYSLREAYREAMGLLTVKDIKEIRRIYGVNQKEYAQLLGVGEVTIQRYERKAIQDNTYDIIMRLTRDNPNYCLQMLETNKKSFDEKRYLDIKNNIMNEIRTYRDEGFVRESILMQYLEFNKQSEENGYTRLDIKKTGEIMNYIASYVEDLYKVKLMKMLWYIDQLNFKRNGKAMTGLVYQHMPYGALPVGHYDLVKLLSIRIEEEEYGDYNSYKILPGKKVDVSEFSFEEISVLQAVIEKFRSFKTKEIVSYMHRENAYMKTREKEIIVFTKDNEIEAF